MTTADLYIKLADGCEDKLNFLWSFIAGKWQIGTEGRLDVGNQELLHHLVLVRDFGLFFLHSRIAFFFLVLHFCVHHPLLLPAKQESPGGNN